MCMWTIERKSVFEVSFTLKKMFYMYHLEPVFWSAFFSPQNFPYKDSSLNWRKCAFVVKYNKKIQTTKISYLGNLSLFKFKLDNCYSSGENWFTNRHKDLTIITDIKWHMWRACWKGDKVKLYWEVTWTHRDWRLRDAHCLNRSHQARNYVNVNVLAGINHIEIGIDMWPKSLVTGLVTLQM